MLILVKITFLTYFLTLFLHPQNVKKKLTFLFSLEVIVYKLFMFFFVEIKLIVSKSKILKKRLIYKFRLFTAI